jgi:hypothetical protein
VGAFGEKLRKQRERRGIELEAISNTTKISTRMLRALEDENFDQLPGGVFNKGFVRAYARQIGLNEEQAVSEYLEALRDSQLQQQSITPDFRAPAAIPAPIAAAPDLGNQAPPASPIPDNVLPSASLPANDSNKDGSSDQKDDHKDNNNKDELSAENRRKQARRIEERRNEERRIEDRRLEARRIEARRDEDRSGEDRSDEDRRPEDSRRQNQTQTQTKDFPALPASTPQAAAANPPASRFRQKYPAGDPTPADQSSASVPWGKLALALLLITLILAFWNFRRNPQPTAASPGVASSNQSPAPASGPAPAATQPSGSPTPLTGSASPAGPPLAGTPSSATISASTTPAAGSAPPTRTAARTPAAKPPATFTLLIRAEESTWVSLTADGEPVVTNETLIAPAQTSVRATREIVVKTGNAAGISFLLNGRAIPAQGNEGEPRTYVVDASGVHIAQ